MVLIYDECKRNARAANTVYSERFFRGQHPMHETTTDIVLERPAVLYHDPEQVDEKSAMFELLKGDLALSTTEHGNQ